MGITGSIAVAQIGMSSHDTADVICPDPRCRGQARRFPPGEFADDRRREGRRSRSAGRPSPPRRSTSWPGRSVTAASSHPRPDGRHSARAARARMSAVRRLPQGLMVEQGRSIPVAFCDLDRGADPRTAPTGASRAQWITCGAHCCPPNPVCTPQHRLLGWPRRVRDGGDGARCVHWATSLRRVVTATPG